jgi:YNFM family putative membrane transporter
MYMFFYYAGASSLGTLGGVFLESYGWSGVIGMVAAAVIICLLVVVRLELAVRQHLLWHH